jgi:hypothetical protein
MTACAQKVTFGEKMPPPAYALCCRASISGRLDPSNGRTAVQAAQNFNRGAVYRIGAIILPIFSRSNPTNVDR